MGVFSDLGGILVGGAENPRVPPWNEIQLGDQQQAAIDANLEALPSAQALASRTNTFNQAELERMLASSIPGYANIKTSIANNIGSMVRGELPQSVQDQVQMNAAAKAIGGGFAGSGMHSDLVARDLGLTSLNLTQQGLSSAESWIRTIEQGAPLMNVASMFITPAQQFDAKMKNAENAWGVQWMKNQVSAMGDPLMTAIGSFLGGGLDMAASFFTGGLSNLTGGASSGGGQMSDGFGYRQ